MAVARGGEEEGMRRWPGEGYCNGGRWGEEKGVEGGRGVNKKGWHRGGCEWGGFVKGHEGSD